MARRWNGRHIGKWFGVVGTAGLLMSAGPAPGRQSQQQVQTARGARTESSTVSGRSCSAEQVAQGEYVSAIAHCFLCHSEVSYTREHPALPLPGKMGSGHVFTSQEAHVPPSFRVVAPNITPDPVTGIGRWSEEQVIRAVRQGIGHDGRTLFPFMPYAFYHQMTDSDARALVCYLRTIPPVRRRLPSTRIPEDVQKALRPLPAESIASRGSTPVERGRYLANLGECAGCHTPRDQNMQPIPELKFAGGFIMEGSWGHVASANLTPDPSSPIYAASVRRFIRIMRTGQNGARMLNPIMPYGYFRKMTDQDLADLYAYLRTLKPVQHRVDNEAPPTFCRICKHKHGLGDRN